MPTPTISKAYIANMDNGRSYLCLETSDGQSLPAIPTPASAPIDPSQFIGLTPHQARHEQARQIPFNA